MVQSLWKTWWSFKTLRITIRPSDPTSSQILRIMESKGIDVYLYLLIITALGTTAKRQKLPMHPSTDKWINKIYGIDI